MDPGIGNGVADANVLDIRHAGFENLKIGSVDGMSGDLSEMVSTNNV